MAKNILTVNNLNGFFKYDHKTGTLQWKINNGVKNYIGKEAGYKNKNGYRQVLINKKGYLAHRIAWAIHHAKWPDYQIDHINGITDDNRIENLREATPSENRQNIGKVVSRSGFLGVTWHKKAKRWQASIKINGKSFYLGIFKNIEDASKAYIEAKSRLHTFQPTLRIAA